MTKKELFLQNLTQATNEIKKILASEYLSKNEYLAK